MRESYSRDWDRVGFVVICEGYVIVKGLLDFFLGFSVCYLIGFIGLGLILLNFWEFEILKYLYYGILYI